ncbi:reverse transcriptase domain-containing protein [Tanacetum coccineum]
MGLSIPIYPKNKIEEGMVGPQPIEEEEEFRGRENIDVLRTMIKEHDQQDKMKATPRKLAYVDSDKEAPAGSLAVSFFFFFSDRFSLESSGTSDTHKQNRSASKSRRTPSKNKEPTHLRRSRRLEDQSITKEKSRRERSKPKGKRSGHQETSSDSEHEEGSEDTYEDLNSPYKRPKPTPFTQRITRFKYRKRAKLPQNIRVYEGNKDPEDHLGIFLAAAEQEEWSMLVWCKMFHQTLGGAARNWFDDLDPKSVDSFEELSQKFLEEFSQQKRYAKDPIEIHGIKRRQNEGLQAFMDRFKSESSHIKGVPPVLRISAFMHVHGHPELAKKLNDKISKMVDEMFERVRAFIRGDVATGSAEMVYPPQGGHNTNDCYQLKRYIEEAVASGKLSHMVKDICRNNQRSRNQGRNGVRIINMIREGGIRKRPFEEGRSGLTDELTFPVKTQKMQSSDGRFLGETYHPLGVIDLLVTMGRAGRSKMVLMEFAIIKCRSPFNVIIGRTEMRSLGAVGSTIHSMINFPTNQGIVTLETNREALWECIHL